MKIGIFDSGIGGISVLHRAMRVLPNTDFLFYADTKHVPYGTKTREEIVGFCREAVDFLIEQGAEILIVACNTATSAAIETLRKEYQIPILGMEPAVKPAVQIVSDKRVLVMATPFTIRERKLHDLVDAVDLEHQVDLMPMPKLVTFAERGEFDSPEVHEYLTQSLKDVDPSQYGALVLGCTHFGYFRKSLKQHLGSEIRFVDGGEGTVHHLLDVAEAAGWKACPQGSITYYQSGDKVTDPETLAFYQKLHQQLDHQEDQVEIGGYMMAHFIGEDVKDIGEQIYFAVSEDGLHWQDLNQGKAVLITEIGEQGARDPFMMRLKDGSFVLIATDLNISKGKGWEVAQFAGSRDILVWKSKDLIHWEGPKAHTVGIPEAGCVWAPEAIREEETGLYMVFWASMVDKKQRIYRSWTEDFETFTPAELYLERNNHVIDSTMIHQEGRYFRYSKDETTKVIIADSTESLREPYEEMESPVLASLEGTEGPLIFPMKTPDTWCLMVDQFAINGGYLPLITHDLTSGEFEILDKTAYDMGKNKKRHGSVMPITAQEYKRILSWDQAEK